MIRRISHLSEGKLCLVSFIEASSLKKADVRVIGCFVLSSRVERCEISINPISMNTTTALPEPAVFITQC